MKKIIFFITLILITITNVYAETQTLVKHRIDDVYTYYYDKNLGRERYLYANILTFGGSTSYCLELGKEINGNIYTVTTSFEELSFDKDTLDYIKLVAYYGYDYPGHQNENYYMATQELIWNKIDGTQISWVEEMDKSKTIDVSKEKDEILNLVNTHRKAPSFDGIEIEYTLGESLTIKDTNGYLNRYVCASDNVIIEGNTLTLTKDFNEAEIILTHPNYTESNYLLYTSGASQKMMSTGGPTDVIITLKVKITGGTIEINKLDKDTKSNIPQGEGLLEGALYEIYDEKENLVGTVITGKQNKIENLPLGKYIIKEKTPSKGYLLDENTYTIVLTKRQPNIKVNVYEKVITRKIDIFKVLASDRTGEMTPEVGINFEVYDKNNKLIDTLITDQDGRASIILPYGTYTFKQTTTTLNYYKVEDFNITISEYNETPIYKLLSDSEIKAKVKIIKQDLNTLERVINSNIKFKIYDVTNKKYVTMKVAYPETAVTDTFQIDKNGIFITSEPLPAGSYQIYEVDEKMDGYVYNKEPVDFEITTDSNFVEEDKETILEVYFANKRVKGNILVTKYGEEIEYIDNTYRYKEINLKDVTFNLYAKEDIYENGKQIYNQDELIKELITDENGIVEINELPLGKYYLKEVTTINGYQLDENIHEIDLLYQDQYTEVVTKNIEIKNYLKKGSLVINKYDSETKLPISNTLIEVCTKDNTVIYKGYTDENGQIKLEDLPYGEYYISEIEASTGYRILEDKITFEIKEEETKINIYNERIKVPNTGFTLTTLDMFIIIVTILGIVLIIFFPKEKSVMFLSIIIILLGITYIIIIVYKYYDDSQNNQKSMEAYINNEIETVTEEKYQYQSILEIPSINLKRGILDKNNEYNKAKYNIELIKEEENIIVLAAHNGNYRNSYFGKLNKIQLGDIINYYKNGKLYTYIFKEHYDIKKNGYAEIYRNQSIPSIILITCKDNTDDAQTVYIGYLKEITVY